MPLLDVDNVVGALTSRLQNMDNSALCCPCAAFTTGVISCAYDQWLRPFSPHEHYCHLPIYDRRMQRCLRFRLGCHGLHILLVCLLALVMLTVLTGCLCLATVVLWGIRGTWSLNVLTLLLCNYGMQACSQTALTPRFNQPYRTGTFRCIILLDCLH